MLPPANGWLQHADAAASGGGGGADELDPDVSAAGGAGAAEPANGWGQVDAACGGCADELDPDVSAAGGVGNAKPPANGWREGHDRGGLDFLYL